MKTLFKKSLSLTMLVLLVVLTLSFGVTVKAATTATITFDSTSKRTTFTTSQQIWVENGITVTNNKGSSTSNVADYANPARFYKSSKLTITYENKISQIVFDCNSNSYATALKNSITSGTATVSSDKVTVVLSEPAESYTITSLTGGQVRMDGLTITEYEEGSVAEPVIGINGTTYAKVGGEAVTLSAIIANSDITTATWTSSDESVVTVNDGVVSIVGTGKSTITATITGTEVSTSVEFKVYPNDAEVISIAEALEIANLAGTGYSPYYYTIQGSVTSIVSTTYGNMNLSDGVNEIYLYGLYSSDGSIRYDAMETKPVVGDTIVINGKLGMYSTTKQMQNARLKEIVLDDVTSKVKEQLNEIESFMTLAYKYISEEKNTEAVSGTTSIVASNLGYENATAVENIEQDNFTITFNKGTNSNSPKYYTNGTAIRCYGGNTITFTSSVSITEITIGFGSDDGTNDITVDCGAYINGVWTGKSNKVVFTISGTTGNRRFSSINVVYEGEAGQTNYECSEVDFRIKCGVELALTEIDNVESYGIAVTANGETRTYDSTSEYYATDTQCLYATISLGDVLNNKTRLDVDFTVCAYVVVDGVTYYSESVKTYSVVDLVQVYYGMDAYKEQVTPLVEVLTSLGYTFE